MSEVPVASILTELEAERTQLRVSRDEATISEYAESLAERNANFPPVRLVADGKGRYYIADGWHRVLAARQAKRKKINACVLPPYRGLSPLQSAVRYALQANTDHGLRLSAGDLRNKVRRALAECPDIECLSDRKAANELHVSHQLVSRARAELVFDGTLPHRETGLRDDPFLPREFAARQEFRAAFDRDAARYLEVREYLAKLSAKDPRAWTWDGEAKRVVHDGLVDECAVAFRIEDNPVVKGLPKDFKRIEEKPLPKLSTHDREALERMNARRRFNEARKALEATGRKELIAAARTLHKYRDVPDIFCHLRDLVDYGGAPRGHEASDF